MPARRPMTPEDLHRSHDSGPEYDRASLLGDPFGPEGIDKLWRQSPHRMTRMLDWFDRHLR